MSETNQPSAGTPGHIDVMDGIRALAIVWVVAFHVWQIAWNRLDVWVLDWKLNFNHLAETGFSGVELFFFVSGFCLFFPYARAQLEQRPWPSLKHFAFRRLIKIVPSYWLAIVLILAYQQPAWLKEPTDLAWNLGTHLLFVQNWFHSTESAINGVFWSLGVEVQFYLLFPALAWAFARRPALTYSALCLTAILWRAAIEGNLHDDMRFWMDQLPGYLDLFATGMLAAFVMVWLRAKEFTTAWRVGFTTAALGALFMLDRLATHLYDDRIGNAFWPWTWQVEHRYHLALVFFVLAVGSARALGTWQRALAAPALVFLSTISYNLYIWHQLIAREMAYTWKIPAPATADMHADPTWQFWFFINAVVVAIAWATAITYVFERPLLRWKPGKRRV